ncbi:MAG: hypothetical protein P1U83_10540, partial [Roseovarius sp.]|nr:hypothetical protein [Roseovarius sp.]
NLLRYLAEKILLLNTTIFRGDYPLPIRVLVTPLQPVQKTPKFRRPFLGFVAEFWLLEERLWQDTLIL